MLTDPGLTINDVPAPETPTPDLLPVYLSLCSIIVLAVAGGLMLLGLAHQAEIVILLTPFAVSSWMVNLATPANKPLHLALVVAVGVAFAAIVGFTLVEIRLWGLSRAVFWVMAAVSVAFHITTLRNGDDLMQLRLAGKNFEPGLPKILVSTKLVILGFVLAAVGLFISADRNPTIAGLLRTVSPVWIVGMLLVTAAFVTAIFTKGRGIGVPSCALIFLLAVTPPVIYRLPRSTAAQKHIGVVEYILKHGSVNPHTDIYQAWPGFFAGVAWLFNLSSSNAVEQLAKFWPVLPDIICLLLVVSIGRVLGLSDAQSWLAGVLFSLGGNAVGQDYFSPQAFAFILSLAIVAISVKAPKGDVRPRTVEWVLIGMMAVAMGVSHQLTPYVIGGVLAIFLVFRCLKSAWIVVITVAPAGVWALTHLSVVKEYFNVGDVGNVTGNLFTSPSAHDNFHYDIYGHMATVGLVLAPLVVILLGILTLAIRKDRLALCLAACGASPVLLFVGVHYGNEDIFRATLFAVPWWALLAAYGAWTSARIPSLIAASVFLLALVGYVAADTFNDYINLVRPADLAAEQVFERTAPSGSLLILMTNVHYEPIKSTSRYPVLYYRSYEIVGKDNLSTNRREFNHFFHQLIGEVSEQRARNVYVLFFGQAEAIGTADGLWSPTIYKEFRSSLQASSSFRVIYQSGNAVLLRYEGK